jgi:hypothetical protein
MIANDGRVVLADARADEAATPESDIRAIGAVLYCALTAHWPHAEAGADPLPDGVRDNSGNLSAPRQVRAGVPAYLDELTTDLINKDLPVPSADVLAAELARFDQGNQGSLFDSEGALDLDAFDQGGRNEARSRPDRRRVLVGVGGLVVLALAGTLAAAQVLTSHNTATPGASPSVSSSTSRPPAGNRPTPLKIAADKVRIVDPAGNGTELKDAAKTVDGDLSSFWHTDHYRGDPKFGNKKPGMGVLLDLGSPRQVVNVTVAMMQAGATLELRGGTTDPGEGSAGDNQILQSYKAIDGPKVDVGTQILFIGNADPVQYLLVWVTVLPPDGGQYQIGISDIKVTVQ